MERELFTTFLLLWEAYSFFEKRIPLLYFYNQNALQKTVHFILLPGFCNNLRMNNPQAVRKNQIRGRGWGRYVWQTDIHTMKGKWEIREVLGVGWGGTSTNSKSAQKRMIKSNIGLNGLTDSGSILTFKAQVTDKRTIKLKHLWIMNNHYVIIWKPQGVVQSAGDHAS